MSKQKNARARLCTVCVCALHKGELTLTCVCELPGQVALLGQVVHPPAGAVKSAEDRSDALFLITNIYMHIYIYMCMSITVLLHSRETGV